METMRCCHVLLFVGKSWLPSSLWKPQRSMRKRGHTFPTSLSSSTQHSGLSMTSHSNPLSKEGDSLNSEKGIQLSLRFFAGSTSILLESGGFLSAFAQDSTTSLESLEVSSRVPGLLALAVLVFPLASYLLFNLYRDKLNPSAKTDDWVIAVIIVELLLTFYKFRYLG